MLIYLSSCSQQMLDLYLRVALLSTLSLYVSSLSLKRELESVDTKSLDELASGNEDHPLSLKIRKRADDNNSNQQNDRNVRKREYDGKQGEQADETLVKRVHRLYGKVRFGGSGGQNGHWSSSSWNWRNALMKRGKEENTKFGRENSGIDKRVHRLYGKVKFGGFGGHGNHFGGSSGIWRNAFDKMKRGNDGQTNSDKDKSGIDKRVHHLYSNVRFGGPSGMWHDLFGSHSKRFRDEKRGKDDQTKFDGVENNREKKGRSFMYTKLKFGGRPGGGLSWKMNNPFNNLRQDGASKQNLPAL